jgi:uncharacterized membrane protein YhaH (DUF805 family)
MSYTDPALWFSFKGRVNRGPYFLGGLAAACILKGSELVPDEYQIVYLPVLLAAGFAVFALGIKRCHDRGRAGWFMLLHFIPVLNLWPLIELTFFRGETGANKYGPDPLDFGTIDPA